MKTHPLAWGAWLISFWSALSLWADPSSFLQPQQDIPLTGGTSRFDYQAFDPDTGSLFIAHMGAGQIVVFNTRTNRVEATLAGYPGVTGLLYVPELHRVYASVTRSHQVVVLDTEHLREIARVPAGNFPDGMAYVPDTHEIYVSDEIGGEETIINVVKNVRVASIPLGGEVGNTRFDPINHWVWTAVEAKNELAAIDPKTRQVVKVVPLHGGDHPHGLYLDGRSHLLWAACDKDDKLVTLDLDHFEEGPAYDLAHDPDILDMDPDLHLLYVASESGMVSLFREKDRKLSKLGDIPIGQGAHSVQVDPGTHSVYFPVPKMGKGPVLRILRPASIQYP
ncbi:MAG TPA: YncE family protein [bacterium]|nr:YncE family protein [bacterium]